MGKKKSQLDTIDTWRKVINEVDKLNKFEAAVNRFRCVWADCDEINFNYHSPYTIDAATEYVRFGFNADMAFKYAVDFGIDGLKCIQELQEDFNFNLMKLKEK